MKSTIIFLATILLCSIALSKKLKTKGGFNWSCDKIRINGSELQASCIDSGWESYDSTLDLSKLIVNVNGRLRWTKDGNGDYIQNCKECFLEGTDLTCNCKNKNNVWNPSTIYLDQKIHNDEGELKYDD